MITPYYAQMRKVRMLLKREAITGVKVASVEEFQGQVRPCDMCKTDACIAHEAAIGTAGA